MKSFIPGVCGVIVGLLYKYDVAGVQEIGVWLFFFPFLRDVLIASGLFLPFLFAPTIISWFHGIRRDCIRCLYILLSVIWWMSALFMERTLYNCWVCSSHLALFVKWHGGWHLFSQGFLQRWLLGWISAGQQNPRPEMMIIMRWVWPCIIVYDLSSYSVNDMPPLLKWFLQSLSPDIWHGQWCVLKWDGQWPFFKIWSLSSAQVILESSYMLPPVSGLLLLLPSLFLLSMSG